MKEKIEMEIRVNKSMIDSLSDDNIFKQSYIDKVEELEKELSNLENACCLEVDEELEMWELEQLEQQNPKGGSQSWDL